MKLNENDKAILRKNGYCDRDIQQIELATTKTVYKLNYRQRIPCKKAIELLGREMWLSGISRSSFHYTSCRQVPNSDDVVSFDSSKLFES